MIYHIPSIISANYSDASRFLKYKICRIPIIIAAICYMGWVDNQGNVIQIYIYECIHTLIIRLWTDNQYLRYASQLTTMPKRCQDFRQRKPSLWKCVGIKCLTASGSPSSFCLIYVARRIKDVKVQRTRKCSSLYLAAAKSSAWCSIRFEAFSHMNAYKMM